MENKRTEGTPEVEFNLWDIFNILLNKIGIIILSAIFFLAVTFIATKVLITPQYQSVTKMYVMVKQEGDFLTQGDMQTSTYLTKDYAELITSRTVTEKVVSEMGLAMTSEELLGKANVQISADTRVINVTINDPDPYRAAEIANAMREAASEHIQNVMNVEAVNVVEEANIPKNIASPNVLKNTLLGGLIGTAIVILIIVISQLINDTIQISDDIEKFLGINVLSVIPIREGEKKIDVRNRRKKPKRKLRRKG